MPDPKLEPLLGTSHFRVLIGRREVGFSEVGSVTSHTDLTLPADARHAFGSVVLRRALTGSTTSGTATRPRGGRSSST